MELFLGRLHPLLVHFPIGLLIVAFFMEMTTINGRRPGLRQGISWMVYAGASFAALSSLFGWLLRTFDDYSGELVEFHQNMGLITASLAVICAILLQAQVKGKLSSRLYYRVALGLTVGSLIFASHLGASLTHGSDYLSGAFNQADPYDNDRGEALLASLSSLDSLNEGQLDQLNLEVRAILAHNCYQCHSENKQKGELVLENKRGVYQGGKSGEIIVKGSPSESEIFRRISLPTDHDEVMPKKGKTLKKNQIALVKLWIEKDAHWADRALQVFPEATLALTLPDVPSHQGVDNPIDKFMATYFQNNNFSWPQVVEDRVFIRRAYLDIIGLLPEPAKIAAFIESKVPDKRVKLIDALLNDHHNYTQHWLSFWNDLLRNDYSGTGFITGGRKQITDWLYHSLLENKPYHTMVKELVNPTEASEGFIKGIKWRGVVNSSQRTEMQAAQNISQSLMGMNLKCASCHNSFVSNLSLKQAYGFASIFADSALELNRCDQPLGKFANLEFLYPELGSVEAATIKERLLKLSDVMVKPENGRLYRTLTNRYWKKLLGRGLIEPVDEMDNEPWNQDLLDWLASDLINSEFDVKHLIRVIMTSKTYQLPTVEYDRISEVYSEKYIFKGPVIRRLSAEQFSDAVSQVIAPVYHATAYSPNDPGISSDRIWHREIKFDRDVLPEPGERFFRYLFEVKNEPIESVDLLVSVDHSYELFLNHHNVLNGANWEHVDKAEVKDLLQPGKNIIALKGINGGKIAKPAGILLAMKIQYQNGEETVIQSNKEWISTADAPGPDWTHFDFNDENWSQVRNYGSKHWDQLVKLTFEDNARSFARASLVRQHPFMKSLGRPTRENVATSRDEQATLLQALELTNGEYFNKVLEDGAAIWLESAGNDSAMLIENLYQQLYGRAPSKDESRVINKAFGEKLNNDALQDIFWAAVLSPEFQFIY